ncbi:MAG: O-antigen ligase family protein [Candidatus Tyrphobacter sp.]
MTWRAITPAAFALTNLCVPLFPSFIVLAGIEPPGIALVPRGASAALLGLFAVLGILFAVRLTLERRQQSVMRVPLVSWLCAGLLAAALGFEPRSGLVFLGIFALGIVWNQALLQYYAQPRVASAIVWAMMIACAGSSIVAIIMVALRRPAAQYVIGHGRAIGTFVLPGELAGYLIVLLPISYAIAVVTTRPGLRVAAAASTLLGAAALVLTFSRAGWVALAAGVAFLAIARLRASRASLLWGGAIVAMAVIVVLALFNVAHNPSEDYTRLSIWRAALQIVERFPLTGVGPFAFSRLYGAVRAPNADAIAFHAHSVYLTLLAETGIVGVGAAIWTWWSFAAELRRRLGEDGRHAFIALAVAAGLVGTLVQGLIDTVSVVLFGLWLPTMAFALACARYGLAEPDA